MGNADDSYETASSAPGKQRSRKRFVIRAVIAILVLCVLCCVANLLFITLYPHSPRNTSNSMSEVTFSDEQVFGDDTTSVCYPTIEEAIKNGDPEIEEGVSVRRTSEELFRFEDEDAATVYFFGENSDGAGALLGYIFDKKDNEYSKLLFIRFTAFDPAIYSTLFFKYTYSADEEIAFYIEHVEAIPHEYSRANDGQPTYIGVTQNEDIYNLRILGEAPTEILTFYNGDERYYIWYYIGTDYRPVLKADPDFTYADFTLGQIIDILDIHFEEN